MTDSLRRYSSWLARLAYGLVALTALVILVPSAIGLVRAADGGLPLGPILIRAAVIWAPALFYLYAVAALAGAFGQIGKGRLFGQSVARGCMRAGLALAIGSVVSALGVPNALRILREQGVLGAGPEGLAGIVRLDLAYLAVGVVGIALILLGNLFRRAASMEEELGEFF